MVATMSWSPLRDCKEEGWKPHDQPDPPPEEERRLGAPLDGMTPRDWMILGKLYEGKKEKQIGREMGLSQSKISQVVNSPAFKAALKVVEERIVERIARGEFGIMAIFKAEMIPAARRIIGISKVSEDDRVRLAANESIVKKGGYREPAPAVTESPERLLDQMTAEELDHFSKTSEFPDRFKDQLARLASTVLEINEKRRWTPHVDAVLLPQEDVTEAPKRSTGTTEEDGGA